MKNITKNIKYFDAVCCVDVDVVVVCFVAYFTQMKWRKMAFTFSLNTALWLVVYQHWLYICIIHKGMLHHYVLTILPPSPYPIRSLCIVFCMFCVVLCDIMYIQFSSIAVIISYAQIKFDQVSVSFHVFFRIGHFRSTLPTTRSHTLYHIFHSEFYTCWMMCPS